MRAIAAGLSRASQMPPSEPNVVLRGEVVGVGLRRVQRQPARTRRGVDQDQGITGLEGPFDAHR